MKDIQLNPEKVFSDYKKKITNMQEHERQKFSAYLYVIFSLITLSFFGIFAIKPTLSTISGLNTQYETNQALHAALVKKSDALKSLDVQYGQLTPDLPIIFAAVPRSTLMAYLTRQIETIAQNNNMNLVQLSFGTVELYPATKENPSLYSFSFNAVLEGDEADVKSFIAEIIQFDRLVNIEQLSTGVRETGKYGLTITGKVYFSKN